jgi:hypothetical protein
MVELDFKQTATLELMRAHADSVHDALRALDDKAQQNISVSSIIVILAGAFNLSQSSSSQTTINLSDRQVGLVLVIYALVFFLSFIARLPRTVATYPMKVSWEEAQEWLDLENDAYYDKLIASYTDVVADNKRVMQHKSRLVLAANFFLALDVVVIGLGIIW